MNDRDIFRGKTVGAGIWQEGTLYFIHGKPHIVPETFFDYWNANAARTSSAMVKSETVGQCTGLRDKHGKLIFGGDIVKIFNGGEKVCYVDWCKHICGFGIYFKHLGESVPRRISVDVNSFVEIIGNIYDNADLLR